MQTKCGTDMHITRRYVCLAHETERKRRVKAQTMGESGCTCVCTFESLIDDLESSPGETRIHCLDAVSKADT